MSLAEELKTTAIVGTAQKELDLSGADGNLKAILEKLDSADKEGFLLASAAVFSSWQNAGKILSADTEKLPETSDAETRKSLSGNLKQHFETQLNSSDKRLFFEFLELMKRHERIIPPEHLPLTFALANTHFHLRKTDFRLQVTAVAGNRGKWLARQNERWRWVLIEETSEEIFETGKTEDRIFALEYLRKTNANRAREILQTSWASEAAKERQNFIEVLRLNLSAADEEFLDEVLCTDKSSEVRQTVYDLLASLPDSKLIKNSTAQFFEIADFTKGGILRSAKFEINFPIDFDKKDFDYYPFPKSKQELGRKGWKLAQILSAVSLSEIEKGFVVSPKDFIAAVKNNAWTAEIFLGLSLAAARQKNFDWYEALAAGFKQNEILAGFEGKFQSRNIFTSNQRRSAESLTSEKNEAIANYLLEKVEILNDGHSAFKFLNNYEKNWGEKLSENFLHSIKKTFSIETKREKNQFFWTALNFLPQAAMRMPIRFGEKDIFGADENYHPDATNKLREFEEILRLRFQINEAFENEE